MRRSDALTIEKYVPSLELMGRAARGVFLAASWRGRVAIVMGSGNNGGDGFVVARLLHDRGYKVTVILVDGEPKTQDAITN